MQYAGLDIVAMKLFNRVLSDYPMARERLAPHAGKTIAMTIGPIDSRLRITAPREMELVGEGADSNADVAFKIPLALLPKLARKDESAYSEVVFSGDSELASTLSTLFRQLDWDIEEDLSQVVGDIAAHRIVGSIRSLDGWKDDAKLRITENIAEYLTEERQAFITSPELESLTAATETLRDDIARLDARLNKLNKIVTT